MKKKIIKKMEKQYQQLHPYPSLFYFDRPRIQESYSW